MSKDPTLIDEGRNPGRDVLRYHGETYGVWSHTPEAKKIMERMRNGEIETYIPNTVLQADLLDYYAEYVLPYLEKSSSSVKSASNYSHSSYSGPKRIPSWQEEEMLRKAREKRRR